MSPSASNPFAKYDIVTLRRLDAVFAELCNADLIMGCQQVRVLLHVAMEDGIMQDTLPEKVNLSHSAVSRNISYWSQWSRFKRPGLNCVYAEPTLENRRFKAVFLTDKGSKFIQKLINLFKGD